MHGVCCVPEWIKSFIVEMHDWLAFVFKLIKKNVYSNQNSIN